MANSANSNFIIPKDSKEYETEETIQDSISILKILKGKNQFDINRILITAKKISESNSVL
tara:strand:- start:896 stop:1075 length:180 start_codon:yes stop_codon:yes gene_type:complete